MIGCVVVGVWCSARGGEFDGGTGVVLCVWTGYCCWVGEETWELTVSRRLVGFWRLLDLRVNGALRSLTKCDGFKDKNKCKPWLT